jgi:signal transduction histidine kinase
MRRSSVKLSPSRRRSENSGSETSFWDSYCATPDGPNASHSAARASLYSALLGSHQALRKAAKYEAALEAMARQLTSVADRERQKIAEQLHDHFGQDLLLIKLKLQQMANAPAAEFRQRLSEITDITGALIGQTRASIRELSASYVCDTGLDAALQYLARDIEKRHGLVCHLALDSESVVLSDEAQRVLYRATRELLINVVKHARASQIKIVVRRKLDSLTIEVCDDGRGFECRKTGVARLAGGSFGLFSVRANLAALGGNLRMVSKLGKGTKAMVTVPVDIAN